jgi:hypothetical protein
MTGIAGQKPPLYTGRAMQFRSLTWIDLRASALSRGFGFQVSIMTGEQVEALADFSSSAAIYRGG